MPTTGPAPEWEWYDNTDLKTGSTSFMPHPWELTDEEIEEWQAEMREKESRRIRPGFGEQ